ncbi:pleckstrin homology domain-containing family O member 2 isoform X1 [Fundulus heteroclitus]|uniref:Nucleolin 2 n=1 Tax=Fundulus heteroclitus TaxID=8078 RepID=A0A147AJA0_FUNHE|nr:pleckstrin homology domain-containing family O member 2 isoform X1 [Fundulus heteroclitus]
MEDGTKEDSAQQHKTKFLSKAGWVKKAHGRLLTSYKDRYVHVEKTEIAVYENEDLQNCLERLDLENYDTCHELKSPFKKKHRLILIRSLKSGNKIHDVKFQTQTVEEKEAWIKALSDCISRAKNKVFDEVKVDESSNLEHITRTRPQGNRNRRPPTRIHMKEVAGVSSDGLLRLDLDLEDAVMPNGTTNGKTDGSETSETAINPASAAEKQSVPGTDEEKKVIKPPIPPTKEAKSSFIPENEPNTQNEKEVLKPPMPPSKESKPCVTAGEEIIEDDAHVKKNTGPPPTPPNKPSSSGSLSNVTEVLPTSPNPHPPTPPSKDKKPSQAVVEPNQQIHDGAIEKEMEGDGEDEAAKTIVGNDEIDHLEKTVQNGRPMSTTEEVSVEIGIRKTSDNDQKKNNLPEREKLSVLIPNEIPKNPVQPDMQRQEDPPAAIQPKEGSDSTTSDTSASSLHVLEPSPHSAPSVDVCLHNPTAESLNLSPLLCRLPGEKKKKAEEKSVDSGQHSDDESEGSVSENTLAASMAALRGSHAGLNVLDATEDESQTSVHLRPSAKLQVEPNVIPSRRSEPFQKPLKPSSKPRSASIGDLLSDSLDCNQQKITNKAEDRSVPASKNYFTKLESEVALEMKNTSELLNQAQERSYVEVMPEDLLAKALEKLQKADCVLREVKKLKLVKNLKRMSW